nr:RNA-dependent RNA polymerase [Dipteran tombus-related virus]
MLNRHSPITTAEYDSRLFNKINQLRRFKIKPNPYTADEYVNSMDNSSKRNYYRRVLLDIRCGKRISSVVCPFTKLEKCSTDKYKAPRLIQGRHPTFNIVYGSYIKPLERGLKHRLQFGKGTYDQIAAKVHTLSKRYKYYTELDHSTFDAHVTTEMLKLVHKFYLSCYDNDNNLRKLCKRTINNFCVGRHGEKYTIKGTRMSGDVDTALGNSLINYHILKSCLSDFKIRGEVIVNGDDSVLFTHEPIPTEQFTKRLRAYNMESKVAHTSTSIHTISFCRTKLVYHPDGSPTMAFDPDRLRDIYGMSHRRYPPKQYERYCRLIHHTNHFININSPVKYQWQTLTSKTIDIKELIIIDPKLARIFLRNHNNRPWPSETLTPSFIEAYPNFKLFKRMQISYPAQIQRTIIINHNNKELTTL